MRMKHRKLLNDEGHRHEKIKRKQSKRKHYYGTALHRLNGKEFGADEDGHDVSGEDQTKHKEAEAIR